MKRRRYNTDYLDGYFYIQEKKFGLKFDLREFNGPTNLDLISLESQYRKFSKTQTDYRSWVFILFNPQTNRNELVSVQVSQE